MEECTLTDPIDVDDDLQDTESGRREVADDAIAKDRPFATGELVAREVRGKGPEAEIERSEVRGLLVRFTVTP
jgi:hypothetical protein